MSTAAWTHAWAVFCKELLDALRDRRTLVMVLLNSQGKLSPLGDANRIKQWLEGNPSRRAHARRRA